MTTAETTTMLPPGDYLIIDPCYILERSHFEALIPLFIAEDCPSVLTDPQTGALFGYAQTATGDGTYADQDGQWYGVDTGGLACLPLGILDAGALASLPTRDQSEGQVCCGRLVTFTTPSPCLPCDAHGVIRFGHIAIQTGPTWEAIRRRVGEDDD